MTAIEIAEENDRMARFNRLAFSIYHITVTPMPKRSRKS